MVHNLQRRGDCYYFYRRVPKHLIGHYGHQFIRKSLNTTDLKEATRKVETESRKYDAEFKVLSEGKKLTPSEISLAGRALAEQYDLDSFIDYVIQPARQSFADSHQEKDLVYDDALPSEYLKPHQLEAWKVLAKPDSFHLSDALRLYLKTHQRGIDDAFTKKVSRDWKALIGIPPLGRTHSIGMIRLSEVLNGTTAIYGRIQARGSQARPATWRKQSRHR